MMQEEIVKTTGTEEMERLRAENEALKAKIESHKMRNRMLQEENMLLRVFENDYKAISGQTLVGILILQDDRYVYVSDALTALTGYTTSTILNISSTEILNFIHPEDRHIVKSTHKRRNEANSAQVFNTQCRLRKKHGNYIWIETWSKKIMYRQRPASIVTYVDITEKLTHQQTISESQALYSNLFENSPTGLIFADKDGVILEANSKVVKMMGSPSVEATKQINLLTFPPIVNCGFADLLQKSIAQASHFSGTTYYESKWGISMWVDYYFDPIKNSAGEVVGTLINFIDVTEQKKNETALLESEAKLRKIFLSSPNAIAVVDKNGHIINCNDQQIALFGYRSKSEIIGMHAADIIPIKAYLELKKRIIRTPASVQRIPNYECKFKKCSGETFFAEISGGMILNNEGKPTNFIAVTQDITIRKQNEKELIFAKNKAVESDRLKSAFLENMSHEIRTPLNGIIGFLDIITDDDITPDEKKEFIDIIHNCSNQLLAIINDILEVSKITSGQLSVQNNWVDFKDLFREIELYYNSGRIKQLKSDSTFSATTSMDGHHTILHTDAQRLRQILTNLVNNALKFCTNGNVGLSCHFSQNIGLVFSVSDTGVGIPENMHELIFERFRQVDGSVSRKYGGTGLGLAICRSLVEILGGEIWVESEVGKGAIFSFTLPYDPDHVSEPLVHQRTIAPNFPDKRMLYFGQDDQLFTFIKFALRDTGIKFIHANSVHELKAVLMSVTALDVVLTDEEMANCSGDQPLSYLNLFPVIVLSNGTKLPCCLQKNRTCTILPRPLDRNTLIAALKKAIS